MSTAMLPLVQMHQMVPTPPHLDPHPDHLDQLSPFFSNLRPGYMAQYSYQRHHHPQHQHHQHQHQHQHHQQQQHHHHHHQQQQQQQPRPPPNSYSSADGSSLPFQARSSQPALQQSFQNHQPPSLFHSDYTFGGRPDNSQHQLRRKTPSGTIDAGYDGSPAESFGPPPLKQLIVPSSSTIYPTAFVQACSRAQAANSRHVPLPASNWQYTIQRQPTSYDAQPAGWNLGQPMQPDGARLGDRSRAPIYPQHLYGSDPRLQNAFRPPYQQTAARTAFNPAGFTPPPVWRDSGVSEYSHHVPLSNLVYIPQNAVVDAAYVAAQQSAQHPLSAGGFFGAPGASSARSHFLNAFDSEFSLGQQQLHTSLASSHTAPDHMSGRQAEISHPAQFKDRALSVAHKSYASLLDYLSRTKQAQYAKSPSGTRSSSKMVVFPTVPKELVSSLSSRQNSPGHAANNAFASSPHGKYGFTGKLYHQLGAIELPSPVNAAKQSLEMLTNLCEQSSWKWIDGMLLGGCLHYGLEHYEEALDWFKRIVNLDSRHVEAISNIAATLYCLNRHNEAEKHWLDAISIRPSYLEAAEHLVGLLCSNHCSRQAVEIISNLQHTLRIVPPEFSTGAEDEVAKSFPSPGRASQPGFGSSGYMVPGHDNGRILLLIHAKGNMLYALKDIERASEAFEEVVMIATGRSHPGIQSLIRDIQAVLAPRVGYNGVSSLARTSGPLLLPPEKAKRTADYLFAQNHGQLPGLRYIGEGKHRASAVATTSNSLLSLAKIFQDSMATDSLAPRRRAGQPSGVGDILALYYLSLSLQESPSTANNVGILLASVQQSFALVEPLSVESSALVKHVPGIVRGSGLELALLYYQYGLTIDPNHVHLHTNLGSLLKDIGQLDMAIGMYERAVACDGNFDIALTNLANAVKDRGRINDAISYYRRAVKANPNFAEAVCGLSTALNSVCDWRGRGGVYLYEGKFDRWHVDDDGMLRDVRLNPQGSGLMKRVTEIVKRQLDESASWGRGTLQDAAVALLCSQLSRLVSADFDLEAELRKWNDLAWEGSRILRLIERATRVTQRKWYLDKYVEGRESAAGYPRARLPSSLPVPSAPTVLPFHTFTCPLTAKDIRMISQRNAHRISCSTLRSPWLTGSVYRPPPPPQPHLNVGYLSSDFNNHPLAHLMQSVFGFHDQSRVRAHCYATTASDKSVHRRQIESEAPVFRDVSNWSSDRLVDQIVQDNIHILVNLNGYTRGARNEIFAVRPAPIQMSFMGFAGTLGAEWCDYLLADSTAVPPSTLRPYRRNVDVEDIFRDEGDEDKGDWVYSENIIYCRDTFFCCDHAQSPDAAADRMVSWEDEQARRWKMRKELFPRLPDDAIILGNFNQLYKIDPTTFRTWLKILSQVPKAVLWLLRFPELGECNLRNTARDWAGEHVANRIIFTDVAPKQQHISRARVCDLFLDTPECNAHTTAADILWSSTPLLTLPRYEYKMCSRMAAAILKGALPKSEEGARAAAELIAADEKQYEEFAVELANGLSYRPSADRGYCEGSGRLAELRRLLWENKFSCALFDTRRWVRDLEDAYDEAWRRWVAGEGGDIFL